jgi:hypothetical protein
MTRSIQSLLRFGGFGRVAPSLLLLCLAGCGGPQVGSVTGTVTWNGKPIERGLITFSPNAGAPHPAAIIAGKYETGEIPTGEYKIMVILSEVPGAPPVTKQPAGSLGEGLGASDLRAPAPSVAKARLDPKYGDASTSGLSFTVKSGPNTYDPPDLK